MIGRLKGVVEELSADQVLIDVQGVGYVVSCSAKTLSKLPGPGGDAVLEIETLMREDRLQLIGFSSKAERDWYRLLTTVQAVGSRVALAILSALNPDEITQAIAAQDKASLTRADGVGPKLAQRIMTELKDKVGGMALGPGAVVASLSEGDAPPAAGAVADAISALTNLGYDKPKAQAAVASAAAKLGPQASESQLIPAALRELAS
ncbi:MAG: Holliday junction branch migration protein RuvA [Alphaproteobacteria bacterium]|nr:Holliday junction branch migration protein RuvA [Alphaproteobacteria bacterium]